MVPIPPGRATKASPRSSMMALRSRRPSVTTSSLTAVSPTPRSRSARGITPVTRPPCSSTERESAPMSPTRPPPYTRRQCRLAIFSPSSTAMAKYFASTASLEPQKTVTAPIIRRARRASDGSTVRDARVATEPRGLRAQQGGASESLSQLVVAHGDHAGGPRIRNGRLERIFPRARRLAIPGTDALARIAAELPRPEPALQRGIDVATVLDGQVRDAASGVEHVGRHEGLRGAGIEAGAAAPAAVGQRLVRVEVRGGQEHSNEEPGAELGMEEHGVLADPAEARARGQIALQDRARVDIASADRAACLGQVRRELGEPRRHDG